MKSNALVKLVLVLLLTTGVVVFLGSKAMVSAYGGLYGLPQRPDILSQGLYRIESQDIKTEWWMIDTDFRVQNPDIKTEWWMVDTDFRVNNPEIKIDGSSPYNVD
jgi:hypothetical protein